MNDFVHDKELIRPCLCLCTFAVFVSLLVSLVPRCAPCLWPVVCVCVCICLCYILRLHTLGRVNHPKKNSCVPDPC